MSKIAATTIVMGLAAGSALASVSVSTYDDVTEGFKGTSWTYNNITYSDVNDRSGVFPGGDTFNPVDVGNNVIVENAGLLYNDFPDWGSATNALTFGSAFIPGDNLSLGAFVHVRMDLEQVADAASMQMAFYENGPWIGIQFHLEAYLGDALVASDMLTIQGNDPKGRDNLTFDSLSLSGAQFDSMVLYATYDGQFSAPRLLIDNLSVNYVPAPGSLAVLGLGGLLARRRR